MAAHMKSLRATVTKLAAEVKKLKEKVPRPLSLLAKSQQLKKARQSMLKGSPVCPKTFYRTILKKVELRKFG